ncbi:unnamed protein product [Orchesella dallaii]|uniref:Gustatory receptor n=1 Tax=Orchesella dallaii TaxID=48710 RepID=A0ABP1PRT2_9HEXA
MPLLIMSGYAESSFSTAFLDGLKPVVFIGRLLGALSRTDVLKKVETKRKITVPTVYSGCLVVFFFINAILLIRAHFLSFKSKVTTSEKLGEISLPGYACTMFFVYAYLLFGTKRFRNVVQNFLEANQRTQFATQFPPRFPRFCWAACVIVLLMGVTENVMFDVQNLKKADKRKANSTLELYYVHNFYHWSDLIPYHPILTLIYVIIVKFGTWGWVYGDVIAIVLTRAITEKFRTMNEEISELMSPTALAIKTKIAEGRILTLTWDAVRDEFVMLTDLVSQIQNFISPLILACYGVNMYIIMINLFYWIAPYSAFSLEQSFYVYFAFFQFFFRVTTVTYYAAEVHHVSHSIIRTIQRCPNSLYSLSLERLERTLICNPTGICLFGTFMITRRFFISIISFLFTTEIVLLQTTNAGRGNK